MDLNCQWTPHQVPLARVLQTWAFHQGAVSQASSACTDRWELSQTLNFPKCRWWLRIGIINQRLNQWSKSLHRIYSHWQSEFLHPSFYQVQMASWKWGSSLQVWDDEDFWAWLWSKATSPQWNCYCLQTEKEWSGKTPNATSHSHIYTSANYHSLQPEKSQISQTSNLLRYFSLKCICIKV